MAMTEARKRANQKWNDANQKDRYDRIQLVAMKGEKEAFAEKAAQAGQSLNAYALDAIRHRTTADEDTGAIRARLDQHRQEQTLKGMIAEIEDTAQLVTSTLWKNITYNADLYATPEAAEEVRAALASAMDRMSRSMNGVIRKLNAQIRESAEQ